jgi:hypothetical protein
VVRERNLVTGSIRTVGFGEAIFVSADGRSLFVLRHRSSCPGVCTPEAEQLTEVPVASPGPTRTLDVPRGWYVDDGAGTPVPTAVAGGVLVQSQRAQVNANPPTLGLLDLATGRVRRLGADSGIVAAYTPRGVRSSVVAWLPPCSTDATACPMLLSHLPTWRHTAVHDPLPFGFARGGAFSPDGHELAAFVQVDSGELNPAMQLALVDPRTGTLHLVRKVQGEIGEPVGWALWLRDGRHVLVGTFSANYRAYHHYLVDMETGASRLVDFSNDQNVDVNFSSVVIDLPSATLHRLLAGTAESTKRPA